MMYYDIILKSKASFLDQMFTYKSDVEIKPGVRVIVPFGRGNEKVIGIVIRKNLNNINYKVKEISIILDNKPIVSKELLKIAFYIIKNNISDYSSAISTILPPGSIDKVEEYYKIKNDNKEIDQELKNYLYEEHNFKQILERFGSKYSRSYINHLVNKNVLESTFELVKKSSTKYIEYVILIDKDYINKIRKDAIKQIEILKILEKENKIEKQKLLMLSNSSLQSLKSLVKKNIVEIQKVKTTRDILSDVPIYNQHILNVEQKAVFDKIINSDKNNFLIHGVTGSGKTEIYLQLVSQFVSQGKEAIILVPEISLTPQTIDRFQGRFGKNIAVLHSKLSISERADQWSLIKNKKVKIVVGARSAIFSPFENLGIIVIDEEHESSYKSEHNSKYSAIEVAKERAKYNNAKLILGTATPSIKTMSDVLNNKIEMVTLKKRVNNIKLPQVSIVDMREELKSNNFSMFSHLLKLKINEALVKKEQIILFLNKRGHTSFVFCRSCGYVHKCDACDVAMTYHKKNDRLICHYCGRTALKHKTCINCGSSFIKEYGAGTEKLEEETKKIFPNAKIFRMDADSINSKDDYDKVYRSMKNGEIDILIGTQMLAKGLDFPNVSVVGIVSADVSLNIPDFRANEKTYGLITQVSGRAGRGEIEGNVIIQTYNPNNFAIETAASNDFDRFLMLELQERKKFNYPPFIKILNINLSSSERAYAIKVGQKIMIKINAFLREYNADYIELTGPVPSQIEKINNKYKFDIILKSKDKDLLIKISERLREEKRDNKVYLNYKLEEE